MDWANEHAQCTLVNLFVCRGLSTHKPDPQHCSWHCPFILHQMSNFSAAIFFLYPRIARFVRILGNKIFVRYCTYLTIWAVACVDIVFSEVNIWNRSTYSILLKFLLQHIFVFWKQYCMLYCIDFSALFQAFRYKGQGSIPVITTTAKKGYLLKFRL